MCEDPSRSSAVYAIGRCDMARGQHYHIRSELYACWRRNKGMVTMPEDTEGKDISTYAPL